MRHIETPVQIIAHWAQTDLVDVAGRVLASCPSGHDGELVMQEIAVALNARDPLVDASVGLYETLQELRHVINGVLSGRIVYDSLDAIMSRGAAHVAAYRAALSLIKESR